MRSLFERSHLPVTHLVQDPARILVPKIVQTAALPVTEREQSRRCELGRERQRLKACKDAVSAEHRHEPGKPGGREALSAHHGRGEAKRGKVDEAAPVRGLQRLPVGLHAWRVFQPLVEAAFHVRSCLASLTVVLRPRIRPSHAGRRDDVQVGGPGTVRLDLSQKREAGLVEGRRGRRRDRRLAPVRLA